jgi:uncharacterized protein (DUF302 family)
MEAPMSENRRRFCSAMILAGALLGPASARAGERRSGVVRVRSAYPVAETVARIKRDLAAKGIMVFAEIDQARLAADAGIALRPSTLLLFGNPPLGAQFLTSNPDSGLDWPVRLLVRQDEAGTVWAAYTDFAWIARRYGITDRDAQFRTASSVIASVTSSIAN